MGDISSDQDHDHNEQIMEELPSHLPFKNLGLNMTSKKRKNPETREKEQACEKSRAKKTEGRKSDDESTRALDEPGNMRSKKKDTKFRDVAIEISDDEGQGTRDVVKTDSERPAKKGRLVTGTARKPTKGFAKYNTEFYELYDHDNPQTVEPVVGIFLSFGAYDRYKLYIKDPIPNINTIPTSGVRIDDLTISCVMERFNAGQLHTNWPADLDKAGMIRATRMPLGNAAKMWVKAGDIDVDGKTVGVGQDGWYYKWWRGLHCLMGKEGFDTGLYLIRPSYENFIVKGFGFKVGFKAVVQAGEGVGTGDMDVGGGAENMNIEEKEESVVGTENERLEGVVDSEEIEAAVEAENIADEVGNEKSATGSEEVAIGEELITEEAKNLMENEAVQVENRTRELGVYDFAKALHLARQLQSAQGGK